MTPFLIGCLAGFVAAVALLAAAIGVLSWIAQDCDHD
jgi:hypothetical protein